MKNLDDFAKFNNFDTNKKNDARNKARNILNEYKGMSNQDLLNELTREIKKQKDNGTFDKEKLRATLHNVQFLISKEQYKKAMEMLDTL